MDTIRVVIGGHDHNSVSLLRRFIAALPGLEIRDVWQAGPVGDEPSPQNPERPGSEREMHDRAEYHGGHPQNLKVKSGSRTLFLHPDEIDWIEAEGNYLMLHGGGKSLLIRETMRQMEMRLEPGIFTRIHRSAIVNRNRIRELRPQKNGSCLLLMNDGKRLRVSRTYRRRIRQSAG